MINSRLSTLREVMRKEGIAAYIIPLSDPHQSEYPAEHWKAVPWISGFSGSAGLVIVSLDHAGLWTDSRYFIQAEEELAESEFVLHKLNMNRDPSHLTWLTDNLAEHSTVAVDGSLISMNQWDKYSKTLEAKNINLQLTDDLIGQVWKTDRPLVPLEPVFEHIVAYAGRSRTTKIASIRKEMVELGVSHHLITTLDDIAWTLNLRGSDVACNPVFVSYLLIGATEVKLYIDASKVTEKLSQQLSDDGISIFAYPEIYKEVTLLTDQTTLLIHKSTINVQLHEAINKACKISYGKLISRHMKALKNEVELDHFRKVMVKDGVALTKAFYWLEKEVEVRKVTEFEFAAKLGACRAEQAHYFGESFSAIVGYESNGAIIHYRPQIAQCKEITNEGILLVDSGGQYLDGTTDITRTIAFSAPTEAQMDAYTRVLKGHIALAKAKFPAGTSGGQLDVLARHSLWEAGMDYGHGTGHGVGFFLNVHEPPQGFAPGIKGRAASIQKIGMITSNEPGYYVDGEYGIRIENLVATIASPVQEGFLEFETITYFPIATNLIEPSLLTRAEVDWLNEYHRIVEDKLAPMLDAEHRAWLVKKCQKI